MSDYVTKYIISPRDVLYGAKWLTKNAKANIIIVTGMEEHSLRYTEFALALNKEGYSVYAMDYYGQGQNVIHNGDHKGKVPFGAFELFVKNLGILARKLRASGLPLYMIGHSMGSFITQRFIQVFPIVLDKAVIVGSNGPDFAVNAGKILAKITVNSRNRNKESKLLAALSLGQFSKSVRNAKTSADWISFNQDNVAKYLADPLCGGPSTKGFYLELLKGTSVIHKGKNLESVRKDLPILIISGRQDPVGHFGRGLVKLTDLYNKHGISNVTMKLYDKMRHEILNEEQRQIVYDDVIAFLKK